MRTSVFNSATCWSAPSIKLVPSTRVVKREVVDYLYDQLKLYGVRQREPSYWKQYSDAKLSDHFPRFSEWYWRPKK